MAVFPAVFNINEVLVFGIPIVLNPVMEIPFLLVPTLSYCVAYLACQMQLVPAISNQVFWTTPVIFSGYAGTGSAAGAVLQLILIIMGVAVYTPFLRFNEKIQEEMTRGQIARLVKDMQQKEEEQETLEFFQETNHQGIVTRMLFADLKQALKDEELYLLFQPQVDYDNHCLGAEALFRWQHKELRLRLCAGILKNALIRYWNIIRLLRTGCGLKSRSRMHLTIPAWRKVS